MQTLRTLSQTTGTLSKDDDDGSENDGKKMNLRSFKVNRVRIRSICQMQATFWVKGFIQAQKDEGKLVVVCPRPP